MRAGKFMERQRVRRPDADEYFKAKDIERGFRTGQPLQASTIIASTVACATVLYRGGRLVQIGAWRFIVLDSDLHTQKFFTSEDADQRRKPEVGPSKPTAI
jgi:hypothetical protein